MAKFPVTLPCPIPSVIDPPSDLSISPLYSIESSTGWSFHISCRFGAVGQDTLVSCSFVSVEDHAKSILYRNARVKCEQDFPVKMKALGTVKMKPASVPRYGGKCFI